MRPIAGTSLWVGHLGDARDLRAVLAADIRAMVHLAAEELPVTITRDLIYCRFPLVDGGGNSPALLQAAIECVAGLLRDDVATLVYCSAGVSRTPVITAAALATVRGETFAAALERITEGRPADVSPALLQDVVEILARRASE